MSPAAIHNERACLDDSKLHKKHKRDYVGIPVTATVDHLPVELLIQIFVHCSRSPSERVLPQITISLVCRFWRDIILHTPHAWQHIFLDDRLRSIRASHTQAITWLHRSQNLTVDIHIHLADSDNLLPLTSPLLAHVRRWRRFTLVGQLQEDMDFTAFSHDASLAILDNLTVIIKSLEVPTLVGPQEPQPPMKTFHWSVLHDLGFSGSRFHKIIMHTEVFRLPIPQHLSAVRLQSLVIRENSLDNVPDPTRLINFLLCCPELRVFHYHALPHEPSPPLDRIPLPIVHLPRLHTLVLRSTCAVRAILSHIDAPDLRELYLEHTNMEFQLQHSAAFTTELEEGDSGDEAADFSQSPWSDHATGMGLRSLLRRSNPPLEVLEMDYADMRTKDFLWCFDRLNSLQEFRIVASDMSDKVVSMLAPFRIGDRPRSASSMFGTDGSEDGTDTALTPEQPHVRMPKLSALELWNCQRLTGNAVAASLGARVRYTDQVADRNAYSKLSDVAIIGCADFLPKHAIMLSSVLGERLRTQA
ncbi:hypothetical protein BC835DRAFT_1395036 [Cytidiella melzeri]|nr:hypothetical protein BC835DRAFT_1395036 [Cytidiella melzeri]